MSVVLLRSLLTPANLTLRSGPASQTSLKSLLLAVLQQEPDRSTAKVADTISALAIYLLSNSTWPDLLPFLFHPDRLCPRWRRLLRRLSPPHPLASSSPSPTLPLQMSALSAAVNLVTSLKFTFVQNILVIYDGVVKVMKLIAEEVKLEGTRDLASEFLNTLVEALASEFLNTLVESH
ncbi:hypothetical protein ZIOFF_027217 [Zingiber officinale]|uniref:Uncharacterized protein n=1 Tax=Zingiber officinale TaxID=94328 RepID=A0A8J5GXG0_ZINOF|nr:hypothetical protein ZIOFF_027217 [Zingiber officinale]